MTERVRNELIIFFFITGYSGMNNAIFYSKRIISKNFLLRFDLLFLLSFCIVVVFVIAKMYANEAIRQEITPGFFEEN